MFGNVTALEGLHLARKRRVFEAHEVDHRLDDRILFELSRTQIQYQTRPGSGDARYQTGQYGCAV